MNQEQTLIKNTRIIRYTIERFNAVILDAFAIPEGHVYSRMPHFNESMSFLKLQDMENIEEYMPKFVKEFTVSVLACLGLGYLFAYCIEDGIPQGYPEYVYSGKKSELENYLKTLLEWLIKFVGAVND